MGTFFGVAENSAKLIWTASKEHQVAIAKACFPGITEQDIETLINHPERVSFSEDGNEIFFSKN